MHFFLSNFFFTENFLGFPPFSAQHMWCLLRSSETLFSIARKCSPPNIEAGREKKKGRHYFSKITPWCLLLQALDKQRVRSVFNCHIHDSGCGSIVYTFFRVSRAWEKLAGNLIRFSGNLSGVDPFGGPTPSMGGSHIEWPTNLLKDSLGAYNH